MASFPGSIVTTATLVPIVTTEPQNNPSHSGQHNNINGEVIAIETTLGVNPQGSYSTVAVALSSIGTAVVTAQATATSALTTAVGAVPKSAFTGNGVLLAGTATAGNYVAISAPGTNGYVLTGAPGTSGGMNWQAAVTSPVTSFPGAGVAVSTGTAGPWTASYTVGTAANNLVQLNSSGYLPAVNGSLLTNLPAQGMSLVSTQSPSGASSVTFSSLTPGTRYKIVFNLIQNTTTGAFELRFNGDSGNNYQYTAIAAFNSAVVGNSGSGAAFILLNYSTSHGCVATYNQYGEINFDSWPGNNDNVQVNYSLSYFDYNNGGTQYINYSSGSGLWIGGGALSSIVIFPTAGTWTGTVSLYTLN